jgi:O-antigen/teichoic acid export membrane protein
LLAAPVTLMNSMCGQVLRNAFRAKLFAALSVMTTLLTIVLSLIAVVVFNLGLAGAIGGTLLAGTLMLPIRLWTIRSQLRPTFSIKIVRNMLAFGLPLVPAALVAWCFASGDRIVLSKLSTLDQLGLFAIATSAASLLNLFHGALGQAWSPHAYMLYKERPDEARILFGQVLTYILIGFGILSVGITAFADELLKVLATPEFYAAAPAVGPLALGYMVYASVQVTSVGITISMKTKYLAICGWLAVGINVLLNVLFVPRWGMIASSWSIAVAYAFLTAAYLQVSQRLWPVTYEKRRSLTAVVLAVVATVGAMYLPDFPLVEGLIVKSLYCLGFVALLALFHVVDKREWSGLADLLPRRARPLLT